ncbi:T9SS type A sorting domain-containing protein [Tenacibaculum sp. IB213877]|uniref:T9SS type A sorting domain-containing protein n=1 Tax=Tenacibaculum sp. IB213877 TaxID=3097351 RepID=UPI002A5A7AEA|nr:T9SS type A sorting domain-containing protein [Tenacibaculum sp. IB213877]MDY0779749.1 T9SS type A sorting domain-containing protein [Tenacibaculum sp. IB213877]
MIKKVLLLFFFLCTIATFSQEKAVNNLMASPNPFSNTTTISFDSAQEQGIILIVKNVLGKTVFKKGYYTKKGKKEIIFEARNLKPGMYIYAIQSNNEIISKRFVIR